MPTTTISGSTVVFSNSGAAANLINSDLNEDSASLALTFNALAASGGGKNTTLYSIDDGTKGDDNPLVAVNKAFANYDTDLLYKDAAVTSWQLGGDTSANGAHVWIGTDGLLHYDASNLSSTLQALAAGETFTDTFEYTVKMSNGTLSVGTITVNIAGRDDAPASADALYHFDEASGTVAHDVLGGHDGTIIGATHVPGISGNALQFNGSSDSVSVPDSPDWTFGSGDFSIQLWANLATTPGPGGVAFAAHDEGPGTTNKWIFAVSGAGDLAFHAVNGSTSESFTATAPFNPTPEQWYLIDLTRSGSEYNFYINGQIAGSATETLTLPDASAPLTIGVAEGNGHFNGALDEVAIYHHALSAATIAQTYQDWHI